MVCIIFGPQRSKGKKYYRYLRLLGFDVKFWFHTNFQFIITFFHRESFFTECGACLCWEQCYGSYLALQAFLNPLAPTLGSNLFRYLNLQALFRPYKGLSWEGRLRLQPKSSSPGAPGSATLVGRLQHMCCDNLILIVKPTRTSRIRFGKNDLDHQVKRVKNISSR